MFTGIITDIGRILANEERGDTRLTIGCALGYLDFRFPELDWRTAHPRAAAWFAVFNQMPAMQATLPHEA